MPLAPAQRSQLDSIVLRMDQQGATPDEVRAVVDDFLRKHGGPQPPPEQPPLPRLRGVEGAVDRMLFGTDQPEELSALATEAEKQAPKSLGEVVKKTAHSAILGPMEAGWGALKGIYQGAKSEFQKAGEAPTTSEKIGHYAASAIPIFGPAAAAAGETFGRGDITGGLTEAAVTLAGAKGIGRRGPREPLPPPEVLPERAHGLGRMLQERTILGRNVGKRLGNRGLKATAEEMRPHAETLGVKPPPATVEDLSRFPAKAEKAAKGALSEKARASASEISAAKDVAIANAQAEAEKAISQIAPETTPEIAGAKVQEGIKGGRDIGKRRAEELYKASDEVNSDKLIDISAFKEELQAAKLQISANPALRDSTLKGVVDKVLGKPPKAGSKGKGTLGLPDQVTYAQARSLQKALGSSIEGTQGQLVTREVKGLSKKLWGDMTDAMEKSLASTIDRTVEGGGTGALSAEELGRAGRGEVYYRVSRSGDLTYMGPQPDPAAPLRPGEGVVKVTRGQAPMVTQANGPDSEVLARFGRNLQKEPALLEPPEKLHPSTTQDGLEALRAANAHYREYAQVFKRGHVPKIAKAYPERVAKLIPDGGITPVRGLKEAIFGQAERYGTEAEKVAARDAWNTLGETYLRQRLMKGGPAALTRNFDAVGHDVIRELYGATPESRAAIANLRNIGRRIDALKTPLSEAAGLSPEQLAALEKLKGLSERVRKSGRAALEKTEGGFGGLNYHYALLEALFLKFGALKIALPIEGLGGFVAWATYQPARVQRLMGALEGIARHGPAAVPSLARLAQQYSQEHPPTPPPEGEEPPE